MAVMSVTGTWPPPGRAFTVADLDRMPDDGRPSALVARLRRPEPPQHQAPDRRGPGAPAT